MIESRGEEAYCTAMARFAFIRRRNVICGLAGCDPAIVATHAGAHDQIVVKTNLSPCDAIVATFAEIVRLHVVLRFSRRTRAVMTSDTGLGRASEASIEMTGFALDGFMSAGERKSGLGVIKYALGALLS